MKLSENTSISLPARNLIAILAAVAIGTMSYFSIIERLNSIESDLRLIHKDIEAANAFLTVSPKATWSVHKSKSSTCWLNILQVT